MKFFTAIANALRDIKGGAAEGRRQAQLRRQAETELKESIAFKAGMERLIGAIRLTGDDRKAVIQHVDKTLRGNSHYEKVRDELLTKVVRIDAADDRMKRLDAINDLPAGERDLMAQALDAAMRGDPHYEMARVQVLSRSAIASGEAEG